MKKSRRDNIQKYDRNMRTDNLMKDKLQWHDPKRAPFRLAGFPWIETDGVYRRMPRRSRFRLPEAVDVGADSAAGGQIQFQTDSRRLSIRVRNFSAYVMYHMAPTGKNGFDCYLGSGRKQHFLSIARFEANQSKYESCLFDLPDRIQRNITVNFPLYQTVRDIQIGLEPGAQVLAPPCYVDERPIVAYGTSVTQGGCASRPGMAWTNILSRRLNRPFINLGFSGAGRGEPEVARVIAEIRNPAAYILDYEGNVGGLANMRRTLPAFIRILRRAQPRIPILIISKIAFAVERINPTARRDRLALRDYQRETVCRLRAKGDHRLFFHDGSDLLGRDYDECTVDGVHPTDLGFMCIADALTPVIRKLLT